MSLKWHLQKESAINENAEIKSDMPDKREQLVKEMKNLW